MSKNLHKYVMPRCMCGTLSVFFATIFLALDSQHICLSAPTVWADLTPLFSRIRWPQWHCVSGWSSWCWLTARDVDEGAFFGTDAVDVGFELCNFLQHLDLGGPFHFIFIY